MTTIKHTPGPWKQDWQFIVAPDPNGIHADIYIAEIAEEDCDGRIASPEQQAANGQVIAAAPDLLAACRMIVARWERGDLAEAARACQAAVEVATGDAPPWDITAGLPATRMHGTAATLLTALEAVIVYAENEAHSLKELKDGPEAEIEAERAWKAVEAARDAILIGRGSLLW
jgi:hypothetical protein